MRVIHDPRRLTRLMQECHLLALVPGIGRYPLQLLQYEKGELLAELDEPFTHLLFLLHGRAKAFSTVENGRSVLHALYGGFSVVGDLELAIGSDTARTHMQALTRITCIGIPMRCREQMLMDCHLLQLCMRELAQKLDGSAMRSDTNLLYPLKHRLREYILATQEAGLFQENHTQLAELLGTSYRHLLRTLNELRDEGFIERAEGGFRVLES